MKAGFMNIPMEKLTGPVRTCPDLAAYQKPAETEELKKEVSRWSEIARVSDSKALLELLENQVARAFKKFVAAITVDELERAQAVALAALDLYQSLKNASTQSAELSEKLRKSQN